GSTGVAQTVTLQLKNTSLATAFSTIKQQTGYRFIYQEEVLKNAGKVNVDLKNVPLKSALDKLMEHQPLTYQLHEGTIVVKTAPKKMVKNVTVELVQQVLTGTITSDKGETLAAVTIRNLTTGSTTVSDQNGHFELSDVHVNDELMFPLLGHAISKRVVSGYDPMRIVLTVEDKHLDEAMIVGYGTQVRRNVVGSDRQIDGDELQKAPPMNLTNALAGRLPGLTSLQRSGRPGADDATLQVRGRSSYASDQTPLVIIDGVERPS